MTPPDATAPAAASPDAPPALTIDELSAASQVPSRTIRFYQSKGVLPRPDIRGRVAYYARAHVERLQLIASLQDRGLRIEAIRDLLSRVDKGEVDVAEWLGLEAQLQHPWENDRAATFTEEELYEQVGKRRAGLLNELLRSKLVVRQGTSFLVQSPGLLRIAARLEAAGVDFGTSVVAGDILRKHLARTAKELTELFVSRAERSEDAGYGPAMDTLRPLAQEAVRLVFAQEMQRQLRELVESGRSAKVTARRPRKG